MVEIDYSGEGQSDSAVARRLIEATGGIPGKDYFRTHHGTGKERLGQRLRGLNEGVEYGRGRPVLVLRDLDLDTKCPGDLVAQLLPNRRPRLLLRICVRAAEAWFMADAEAYAAYCGMRSKAIPQLPEELERPKARVLEIMKASGARKLDAHMKEQARLGVSTVSALGVWHSDFARAHWDPDRAAASGRAPSLNRALNRLRALIREG